MCSMKPATSSFASWQTEEIVKHAREAAVRGDIEILSYCLGALSPGHRSGAVTDWLDIIEFGKSLGITPVDWLEKAAEVTHSFMPQTTGSHYLYIILLSKLHRKDPGYALYIGETSKPPDVRFREHTQGKRNRKGPLFSRIVRRHHKCLLPSLYEHLNPLSRPEARKLEVVIAEALKAQRIPVYGGH